MLYVADHEGLFSRVDSRAWLAWAAPTIRQIQRLVEALGAFAAISVDPGRRPVPAIGGLVGPLSGRIGTGPDFPIALPAAVALSSGGRLYVLGFPEGRDTVLKLFSIGS